MEYHDDRTGLDISLPEGWRHDPNNLTTTFFGPNGRIGLKSEVIQLKVGPILPQFEAPEAREEFLAEPGAMISRGKVGDETNVVVMTKSDECEISVVKDKLHYTIMHTRDEPTREAVQHLCQSARFANAAESKASMKQALSPKNQAMAKVMRSSSPEEARSALEEAGYPAVSAGKGYTVHNMQDEKPRDEQEPAKKWWQIWR